MEIIYKTVFEVHLLHEFYLTKQDGVSIFSKTTDTDRESFLLDFYSKDKRSINSDIRYSIPAAAVPFFQDHKLKLVPTYSGFKVATEVNKTSDGGLTAFEPVVPLSRDSAITVFIERSGPDIDSYTNMRTTNAINRIFYLSNENTGGAKTSPFLSNPVPSFDNSYAYQQGELYSEAGKIKSFYPGITTGDPAIVGSDFLNETDRLCVSNFFYYHFDAADNVKQAQFILKDSSGTEVYKNTFTSASSLQTVAIIVDPIKLKKIPNGHSTASLLHNLSVTGDGGYNRTFRLLFLDTPASQLPWAVININPIPADAAYTIIDNSGLLITRLNADRTVAVKPPSFVVCIKSKLTFWRYINNEGFQLKNLYTTLLEPNGQGLATLKPVNHSYIPVPVGTQRFPNPEPFSMIKKEGAKSFADIIVPISDMFPKGP
jgi:hypothetical protein